MGDYTMHIKIETLTLKTKTKTDIIDITPLVKEIVQKTNIQNGIANIFTNHTTTGLFINEKEEGLIKDIRNYLHKIVPEEDNYYHHHFFYKDGRAAVNAWAHLRSILLGAFIIVPIQNRKLLLGDRQAIFFVDLDGPLTRKIVIQIIGDEK